MGYRQYLYSFDRSLVEKIRNCKTCQDFYDLVKTEKPDAADDFFEDDLFIGLYDLGSQLYEFGKDYENSDEMYKHGDSLFSSDELNEKYKDFQPIVIDEDGILCAIDWNRKHCVEMYEDLLREKSERKWDSRSQFERLKDHAETYLSWWKDNPADLNKDHERLVSSWLYENEYFELVRIYKTFDWEKNVMVFMGW